MPYVMSTHLVPVTMSPLGSLATAHTLCTGNNIGSDSLPSHTLTDRSSPPDTTEAFHTTKLKQFYILQTNT